MKQADVDAYGRRLFERKESGVFVPRFELSIGDWRPSENHCHHNVTLVCDKDPRYTAVRGWLIFELRPIMPVVRFTAHSVVRCPDGSLRDITPAAISQGYPFLHAEETETEYAALIDGMRVSALNYDVDNGQTSILLGLSW